MIPQSILATLCWATRIFQHFPGRWRLLGWLNGHASAIKQITAGSVNLGRGYSIWADPSDLDGFRYYINGINPREPISRLFTAILEPGDCLIDIGANVGYFTTLGSMLVGPKGIVHAFEASPVTAAHLKVTAKNPHTNVRIHPVAVSDRNGHIDFSCGPSGHSGASSVRPLEPQNVTRVRVSSVALDQYLNDLNEIKLIKIDIEGAEMMALRGMKNLLEKTQPYVILELTDSYLRDLGSSSDELIVFMERIGYEVHPVKDPSGALTRPVHEQTDVLFTPRSRGLPSLVEPLQVSHPGSTPSRRAP